MQADVEVAAMVAARLSKLRASCEAYHNGSCATTHTYQ